MDLNNLLKSIIVESDDVAGQYGIVVLNADGSAIEGGEGGGASGALADLTDVTLTSAAQGDILYHNDTEWVNLAPGTSGHVLTSGGAAANPSWAAATDATAVHDNVSGEISAITEKASPVSADLLLIEDSEASNAKKKLQVGNIPVASHNHAASAINSGTLAHERGGIEADISAVAIGDIIAGTGAGTMGLVTSTGHNDGDVLTRQSDGSVDWEAPAAGGGGIPYGMDCKVAASGGDYTTLGDALTAGETRIFIEDGSYTESTIDKTGTDDIVIVGASRTGVVLDYGTTGILKLGGVDSSNLKKVTLMNLTIKNGNSYNPFTQYTRNMYIHNVGKIQDNASASSNNVLFHQADSVGTVVDGLYIETSIDACKGANINARGNYSNIYLYSSSASNTSEALTIAANDSNFENIFVNGFGSVLVNGSGIVINNLTVENNKATAQAISIASDCVLTNLHLLSCASGADGVLVGGGTVLSNFYIEGVAGGGDGIQVNNSGNCVIKNGRINITGTSCIDIDGEAVIVEGVYMTGCSSYAISRSSNNGGENIITNNYIKSCNNTIEVPSGCDNNIITYNYLKSNTTNTITDSGSGNDTTGNKSVA